MSKLCDAPTWTDKNGTVHYEAHGRTWDSLESSTRQWLLCQFPQDAAEQQRLYLSHYVICPTWMKIPNFVSRMEQLNGYIAYLPCCKDCTAFATQMTVRMNRSFHKSELAGIILSCFPTKYKNQYYLNHGTVPLEIGALRDKLMQIEKVVGYTPPPPRDRVAKKESTSGTKRSPEKESKNGPKKQKKRSRP